MKLLLEDFGKKNLQVEQSSIEEKYTQKIRELELQIENLKNIIEEEKRKSFEEGYSKAAEESYQKALEEFNKQKIDMENQNQKQMEYILDQCLSKINENITSVKEKYKSLIDGTTKIISDSIGDILEFLYIENNFNDLIVNQINNLIEEFYEYPQISIKVSNETLAEILQNKGFDVSIDENLKGLDFVIDFKEFRIENKIKEKIEIVKNEIKREIKKLSEI